MSAPDPTFPPLLTGHAVAAHADPFAEACAGARSGTLDTGDVLWSRDERHARFAILFRPEVPLAAAAQMLLLAQVGCGDSLGALTPPQVAVTFDWPGGLRVNDGKVGRVRAAVPKGVEPGRIPDWLVIAIALRMRHDPGMGEPGERPEITALAEEGCAALDRGRLISSIARHILTWLNIWEDEGFRPLHEAWSFRAATPPGETLSLEFAGTRHEGRVVGLDDEGSLLIAPEGGRTCALSLVDALERP